MAINSSGEPRKRTEILSPQERLILSLAAQGLADKEIAKSIGISMGTVRTYWQRMRDKTNAKNRSEILSQSYQRKNSEALEDLQKTKGRLAALFEASAVGLALVNDLDEIIEVNLVFAETIDLTPFEIIGLSFKALYGLTGISLAGPKGLEMVVIFSKRQGDQEVRRHQVKRRDTEIDGESFQVLTLIPLLNAPDTASPLASARHSVVVS